MEEPLTVTLNSGTVYVCTAEKVLYTTIAARSRVKLWAIQATSQINTLISVYKNGVPLGVNSHQEPHKKSVGE